MYEQMKRWDNVLFIHYCFIAIAMGLDAFSVSLSLGMQRLSLRRILFFGMIVGVFHSLFPFIGIVIGVWLMEHFLMFTSQLTGILFIALGLYMIVSAFQKKTSVFVRGHWLSLLTLGVAVSVDSLSIGFGLSFANHFQIPYLLLFGFVVMAMTMVGVMIGKRARLVARTYSEFIGGFILLLIGLWYFI